MGWFDWVWQPKPRPFVDCTKWIEKAKKSEEEAQSYYDSMIRTGNEKAAILLELHNLQQKYDAMALSIQSADPQKEVWDNKYPKMNISYNAREFKTTSNVFRLPIDIKLFITPQDYKVASWCQAHAFTPSSYHAVRELALAVYKQDRVDFEYVKDIDAEGINEEWLYPYELQALIDQGDGGDCEDYAHRLASRLIASGVPSWRVRVVCGSTWTGQGHSTVYFLDDDLLTWRHLNSTSGLDFFNPRMRKALRDVTLMSEMPTSNDITDVLGLGIKEVWFSFSDYASWSKFETPTSAESFNQEKGRGMRLIEVED